MLTVEEINLLKENNKDHKLIHIIFQNKDFLFRTLTIQEFRLIYSLSYSRYETEEKICSIACLYPEDYDFEIGFAGLPEYAAKHIENISGVKNISDPVAFYNEYKNHVTFQEQCMDLIKAFIPEYTYDEMETWTIQKLMKYTARAERVAKYKGFDYTLEDKSEEVNEEVMSFDSNNKEFIDSLYASGIDPMNYFSEEIEEELKTKIIDFPIITSGKWNDSEVMDAVRRQGIII